MGVYYNNQIKIDGLILLLDPYLSSSYSGSGSTIYNAIDGTACSLVTFNYDSNNKIFTTPNVGDFFYISIPDFSLMTTALNKTTGGFTLIEWIRVNDLVYPRAAAGGRFNVGYSQTTTRGFDWNHGTQNLTSVRMSGSVPEVNPASTGYDFDTTIDITGAGLTLGTWFQRVLWWNRSTNTHGVYINAVSYGSASHSQVAGYSLFNGGGLTLGTLYGWSHTGARGPVYLYDSVLSDTEINFNFTTVRKRFGI